MNTEISLLITHNFFSRVTVGTHPAESFRVVSTTLRRRVRAKVEAVRPEEEMLALFRPHQQRGSSSVASSGKKTRRESQSSQRGAKTYQVL